MATVDLEVKVCVVEQRGDDDVSTVTAQRSFPNLDVFKADTARLWAAQRLRQALDRASDDQLVRADIVGHSVDGSHYIVEGSLLGWGGRIQIRRGVFER